MCKPVLSSILRSNHNFLFYGLDRKKSSSKSRQDKIEAKEQVESSTLRITACLPAQKVILTVTQNKSQLIELICDDLGKHKDEFCEAQIDYHCHWSCATQMSTVV